MDVASEQSEKRRKLYDDGTPPGIAESVRHAPKKHRKKVAYDLYLLVIFIRRSMMTFVS
jgi:hypothetical protein